MPERGPRASRKDTHQYTEVVPILQGETPLDKINRDIAIARNVGHYLLKYFEDGTYRSPEGLRDELSRIAQAFSLDEIDLTKVGIYIQGVLDERDYDSPLKSKSLGLSDYRAQENSARHALTTLTAVAESFGIEKIEIPASK